MVSTLWCSIIIAPFNKMQSRKRVRQATQPSPGTRTKFFFACGCGKFNTGCLVWANKKSIFLSYYVWREFLLYYGNFVVGKGIYYSIRNRNATRTFLRIKTWKKLLRDLLDTCWVDGYLLRYSAERGEMCAQCTFWPWCVLQNFLNRNVH